MTHRNAQPSVNENSIYFANYLWYLGEVGNGRGIIHLLFPYMLVGRYTVTRFGFEVLI